MPLDVVIPVVAYPAVSEAVRWLGDAFGFELSWQAGEHRAQLRVGESAAIAITEGRPPAASGDHVMVRVEDLPAHRLRAAAAGATVGDLAEYPFGERQYTAVDFAGRAWVFTETVADVDPTDWGASTG